MLASPINILRQSAMLSFPIEKHTEIIMATEATFTASRNIENKFEVRICFTTGFRKATKTNEGKK